MQITNFVVYPETFIGVVTNSSDEDYVCNYLVHGQAKTEVMKALKTYRPDIVDHAHLYIIDAESAYQMLLERWSLREGLSLTMIKLSKLPKRPENIPMQEWKNLPEEIIMPDDISILDYFKDRENLKCLVNVKNPHEIISNFHDVYDIDWQWGRNQFCSRWNKEPEFLKELRNGIIISVPTEILTESKHDDFILKEIASMSWQTYQ